MKRIEDWSLSRREAEYRGACRDGLDHMAEKLNVMDLDEQIPFTVLAARVPERDIGILQMCMSRKYRDEYFDVWKKTADEAVWRGLYLEKIVRGGQKIMCADIIHGNFIKCEFEDVVWQSLRARDVTFNSTHMVDAEFPDVILHKVRFYGCELKRADMWRHTIRDCHFSRCDLRGLANSDGYIEKTQYSLSDMQMAEFKGTSLYKVVMRECDFTEAEFCNGRYKDVDFYKCDFTDAVFKNIECENVKFVDCKFVRTTVPQDAVFIGEQ